MYTRARLLGKYMILYSFCYKLTKYIYVYGLQCYVYIVRQSVHNVFYQVFEKSIAILRIRKIIFTNVRPDFALVM